MSRYTDPLAAVIGTILHPTRARAVMQAAADNPAIARRLMDAAAAEDGGRALRTELASMQWNAAPARPAPPAEPARATREPVSGREWSGRPESMISRTVAENAAILPPELAARVERGDTDALYEAYRSIVQRGEMAERGGQQMGLPMSAPEDQIRALIQVRGRGVPVGDPYGGTTRGVPRGRPYGGPSTDLIPVAGGPLRPATSPPAVSPAQAEIARQFDAAVPRLEYKPRADVPRLEYRPIGPAGTRRPEMPQHIRDFADQFPRAYAETVARGARPARRGLDPRIPLGVAGAAAGAGLAVREMMQPSDEPGLSRDGPSDTADLAAETAPPPQVMSEEDEFTDRFRRQYLEREMRREEDYSLQARKLIDRLNRMRRQAGGEVPEAPQMIQEINRLLALGNEQVRQPTFRPGDKASRYRQQAQQLIDQLNADRRAAGGEVPHAPRVMAEVRRLQAQSDQLRNAR